MRCGVVVFPGSNCDHDVYHVLKHVLGQDTIFLWHAETQLRGSELLVLPGGFSYGDYLRSGAMAARAPVMSAVREHAERGGLILGICNGFQILCEAGLLPGALRRNRGLRFLCQEVFLRVERADTPFTRLYQPGEVIRMPIAHGEGNFEHFEDELDRIEADRQVVFRYAGPTGEIDERFNPNGSARAIAGIVNRRGNVLGLMPHPERASEEILGNTDGLRLLGAAVGRSLETLVGASA